MSMHVTCHTCKQRQLDKAVRQENLDAQSIHNYQDELKLLQRNISNLEESGMKYNDLVITNKEISYMVKQISMSDSGFSRGETIVREDKDTMEDDDMGPFALKLLIENQCNEVLHLREDVKSLHEKMRHESEAAKEKQDVWKAKYHKSVEENRELKSLEEKSKQALADKLYRIEELEVSYE